MPARSANDFEVWYSDGLGPVTADNVASNGGSFDVWYGLQVSLAEHPASTSVFPTTPILDDFNRANEASLSQGGAWTTATRFTTSLELASNHVQVPAAASPANAGSARVALSNGFTEHYLTVVVPPGPASGYIALELMQATTARVGYSWIILGDGTSRFYRDTIAGGFAQIGGTIPILPVAGDKVGMSHDPATNLITLWYRSVATGAWVKLFAVVDAVNVGPWSQIVGLTLGVEIDDVGGGIPIPQTIFPAEVATATAEMPAGGGSIVGVGGGGPGPGPTRFYLPSTGTPAVSPTIGAEWTHSLGTRRPFGRPKGSSALTTVSYSPDTADHAVSGAALVTQFVSAPLAAQTLAAQTVTIVCQCNEVNTSNELGLAWKLWIWTAAGTVGPTLLALRRDALEMATGITNRTDSTTTLAVTVGDGDRLVLDLGGSGTPVVAGGTNGHNLAMRFGESGVTDAVASDTGNSTTENPWIEFANGIAFQGEGPPAVAVAAAMATATAASPSATLAATRNGLIDSPLILASANAPEGALAVDNRLNGVVAAVTAASPASTFRAGVALVAQPGTASAAALPVSLATAGIFGAEVGFAIATGRVAALGVSISFPAASAQANGAGSPAAFLAAVGFPAGAASSSAAALVIAFHASVNLYAQAAGALADAREAEFVLPGTGAIVIPPPILTGEGDVPVSGNGAIVMPAPILAGQAFFADVLGTGGVVIPPPILDGEATYSYVGHGEIEIPPPVLSGEGATPVDGTGGITIGGPTLSGLGEVPISGTGAIVIAGPILEGYGTLIWTGTGAIVIGKPTLTGMAPLPPPGPPPPLPPTDIHVIEAFDLNGVLLGRVQPIRQARFTIVENDVGDFEIELPWIYDDVISIMRTRHRIEYSIKGTRVFGGVIMKRVFRQEGRYSMVTLTGPGYNGFLTGRVIIPPPGAADDVYTNVRADDLMKNIVRKHLGALAAAGRQVPGFTVAANLSQSSVITNYNGRYETVVEALQSIAEQATDTKFQVIRAESGLLEFRTYVPIIGVDHSIGQADTVLFDMAGGNALNVEYVEDGTPVRNYIIGGGTGDDAARMIREGFNAESITDWGRIEEFLDSNAETTAELDLEILKKLEEVSRGGPSLSFTIGQAGRYSYPEDFTFGDKVSAIWKEAGLTLSDVITGMTINLEESGSLGIEMSIGAPNLFRLSPARALARFIKGLRGEVGVMQRH